MTNGEKQFITLLRAFLRGEQVTIKDPDWPTIFKLSLSHNVAGIIAAQVLLMPPPIRPQGGIMSKFTQLLGKTLQKHELMQITAKRAETALCRENIRHAYVKGDLIGALYPQPELRTSADTDIAVEPEQFAQAIHVLEKEGFKKTVHHTDVAAFFDGEQEIELHKGFGESFSNVQHFEETCTSENGLTFIPTPVFHLVYVIKHLIRHFENGGAGIKMFMDIDVLLTHLTQEEIAAARDCLQKEGQSGTAEFLLYLCQKWFGTAIDVKKNINFDRIYTHAEKIVLAGGAFGLENGGAGKIYLKNSIGSDGSISIATRIKALLTLLFPKTAYLKKQYPYAKSPLLLPVAWLQRLFEAVFKRHAHSVQTVQEIMQDDEIPKLYAKVSNELKKIDKKK